MPTSDHPAPAPTAAKATAPELADKLSQMAAAIGAWSDDDPIMLADHLSEMGARVLLWDAAAQLTETATLTERLARAEEKAAKYDRINTPELYDFVWAVVNEALHQRERWTVDHDGGKTDADWFWLIGYLAGKALHNPPKDDMAPADARLHRIITVAAAAANWHAAALGSYPGMRPGIEPPARRAAVGGGAD